MASGGGKLSGPAVASLAAGALFLYAAISGKSIIKAIQQLVGGKSPLLQPGQPPDNPITPATLPAAVGGIGGIAQQAGGTVAGAVSGSGSGSAGLRRGATSAGSPAPGAPSSVSGNVALGKLMAASYGWATGSQWNALYATWQRESGWRNTAQNPTSTAYGIAQFLDSTWASVGAKKTSSAAGQISAGLKYIKQRYGTPAAAWAHEQSAGWY